MKLDEKSNQVRKLEHEAEPMIIMLSDGLSKVSSDTELMYSKKVSCFGSNEQSQEISNIRGKSNSQTS